MTDSCEKYEYLDFIALQYIGLRLISRLKGMHYIKLYIIGSICVGNENFFLVSVLIFVAYLKILLRYWFVLDLQQKQF